MLQLIIRKCGIPKCHRRTFILESSNPCPSIIARSFLLKVARVEDFSFASPTFEMSAVSLPRVLFDRVESNCCIFSLETLRCTLHTRCEVSGVVWPVLVCAEFKAAAIFFFTRWRGTIAADMFPSRSHVEFMPFACSRIFS